MSFISYAKADRPLSLKLAAMLEGEGWKVWWDTSLTIGDEFRNERGPNAIRSVVHRTGRRRDGLLTTAAIGSTDSLRTFVKSLLLRRPVVLREANLNKDTFVRRDVLQLMAAVGATGLPAVSAFWPSAVHAPPPGSTLPSAK